MEKSRRKAREFQFRRGEILESAEKVFAAKGFHEAKMAEIADAAGFATGSLYQFFEGKEDLYTAMVTGKLGMLYEEVRAAVHRARSPVDKLRALVQAHFRFVENHIDFHRLLIRGEGFSFSDGSSTLKEKIIQNHLRHLRYVEDIMREGIRAKVFKAAGTRAMAYALIGTMNTFKFNYVLNPAGSLSRKTAVVLDLFLRGVVHGGEGRPRSEGRP